MSHIFKNDYTEYIENKENFKEYIPESYRAARIRWGIFNGFKNIEKIIAMVIFGQILKNAFQIFEINIPSVLDIKHLYNGKFTDQNKKQSEENINITFLNIEKKNIGGKYNIYANKNIEEISKYLENI
jgi:hypothetical protein